MERQNDRTMNGDSGTTDLPDYPIPTDRQIKILGDDGHWQKLPDIVIDRLEVWVRDQSESERSGNRAPVGGPSQTTGKSKSSNRAQIGHDDTLTFPAFETGHKN